MRLSISFILALALLGGACRSASSKGAGATRPASTPGGSTGHAPAVPIVTPSSSVAGKVQSFNAEARFAVVTFPIGLMPAPESRMNVYRAGLKVAEIKITSMRLDLNVVGDLIVGECRPGDEVRD